MQPRNIFLVRHGQSEGNVDKTIYTRVPDHKVVLTPRGHAQAEAAGREIEKYLAQDFVAPDDEVRFVCSTHRRTEETLEGVRRGMLPRPYSVRFEPRLREQDWGTMKSSEEVAAAEAERDNVGSFHYRLPSGESGADVYLRVSSVLDTLWREFERKDFPRTLILIGHGFLNRIFLMRFFHVRPSDFEHIANPWNGEVYHLVLNAWSPDKTRYALTAMPRLTSDDEILFQRLMYAFRISGRV
jgi:broad specificity phosphatase PhoE